MTDETVPALEQLDTNNVEQVQEADQHENEQTQVEQKPEVKYETPQDRNWREANRVLKELRAQNEELRQQIQQIHSKSHQSEEEESNPDDWVTEKKLMRRLTEMEQKLKAREAETVMDRLKARFNDFDDVVSPENIEYLKENDPELAISLQALKDDPYQQGLAAYKMLKKTDYYLNRDAMKEKKRIEQNLNKPVSSNAVRKPNNGPLGEANRFDRGLTPELRKQLLDEMQSAIKRG